MPLPSRVQLQNIYHGTDSDSAKKIRRKGFKAGQRDLMGRGVYGGSKKTASQYGNKTLQIKVNRNLLKVIKGKVPTDVYKAAKQAAKSGKSALAIRRMIQAGGKVSQGPLNYLLDPKLATKGLQKAGPVIGGAAGRLLQSLLRKPMP